MACELMSLPGGGAPIVCGRTKRQRCACGKVATRLCDWKIEGKRPATCDSPICSTCATRPAPEKDLCPDHARAFAEWNAQRRAG